MASFDRAVLKGNAKAVLKRIFGNALLLMLLFSVVSGAVALVIMPVAFIIPFMSMGYFAYAEVVSIIMLVLLVSALIAAFCIFVIMPMSVGIRKFFNTTTYGTDEVSTLFFAFRKGNGYLNIVKTQFLVGLYTCLWGLIPFAGYFIMIYKMYGYYLVPFILADNPHMPASRAIQLSEQMMHGRRFELFVLNISFIGWYLLSSLVPGIGSFLVMPYVYATEAQFYMQVSWDAMNRGLTSRTEMGLPALAPAVDPQYAQSAPGYAPAYAPAYAPQPAQPVQQQPAQPPQPQSEPSGFGDNFL